MVNPAGTLQLNDPAPTVLETENSTLAPGQIICEEVMFVGAAEVEDVLMISQY